MATGPLFRLTFQAQHSICIERLLRGSGQILGLDLKSSWNKTSKTASSLLYNLIQPLGLLRLRIVFNEHLLPSH